MLETNPKSGPAARAPYREERLRDFYGLSPEENALAEMRVALTRALRKRREALGVTQATVAKRINTSRTRYAVLELNGDSIPMDSIVRALLTVGFTPADIGAVLGGTVEKAAPTAATVAHDTGAEGSDSAAAETGESARL